MNNETKINNIEDAINEEEIILESPMSLIEEAKNIAETTVEDEKYPFTIQYDVNYREFLISMIQTSGAIVEKADDEDNILDTQMNMTQLAFIKRLDCVERVKTDEGSNPFLAEEAIVSSEIKETAVSIDETISSQSDVVASSEHIMMLVMDEPIAMTNNEAEVASVYADCDCETGDCETGDCGTGSCNCQANSTMNAARRIEVETLAVGNICCPGSEQWFKFTPPRSGTYTIYTTGSLDTVGTLYSRYGSMVAEEDDCAGKLNFRIREFLNAAETYYVKVKIKNMGTGSYTIKVTQQVLAESVEITPINGDGVIILEQGKTYELPRGEGYGFLNILDTTPAPFGVKVYPDDTYEKRIDWYASSLTNVAETKYEWYNNTIKYQTITANAVGCAKLYAHDWYERGRSAMVTVVVIPSGGSFVKANGISLSETDMEMKIGSYCYLEATVLPGDATVKEVNWRSDNPNVATVTALGRVKAISPGSATICAEAMDGSGVMACCGVTVQEATITGTPVRVKCSGGLNVMSSATDGNILGTFEDGVTVYLFDETPQNETIYKVYGTMGSGSSTYGWCSGEHLEKEVDFLRCVYDEKPIKVRNSPTASNGDGNIVGRISKGAEVELLDKSVTSQDAHSWYKVRYNRLEAYVVADDAEDDYEIIKKWILLAQDIIKKRIYAATVYAEAAGQNRRSKQAVAHVMNNRIGTHGLWVDIEAVVSASGQFEGYGNSMYQDAMSYYETGIWSNSIEQVAMDECMSVIIPIYNGEEADITGGALYFHSFPNPEGWANHNDYTLITVDGTEGFWFYK